jgi:hypothetical protein
MNKTLQKLFSKKTKILGIPLIYLLVSAAAGFAIWASVWTLTGSFTSTAGTKPVVSNIWNVEHTTQGNMNHVLTYNADVAKSVKLKLVSTISSSDPLCNYQENVDFVIWGNVGAQYCTWTAQADKICTFDMIQGDNTLTVFMGDWHVNRCPLVGTYSIEETA